MCFTCRYTSYGRHFTQDEHLRVLNEFLLPLIHDGDTVVDFSCGANVWVPMLKNMCLEAGFVRPCLLSIAPPQLRMHVLAESLNLSSHTGLLLLYTACTAKLFKRYFAMCITSCNTLSCAAILGKLAALEKEVIASFPGARK